MSKLRWSARALKRKRTLYRGSQTGEYLMTHTQAGALRGPGLVVKDSYKKPIVPVSNVVLYELGLSLWRLKWSMLPTW